MTRERKTRKGRPITFQLLAEWAILNVSLQYPPSNLSSPRDSSVLPIGQSLVGVKKGPHERTVKTRLLGKQRDWQRWGIVRVLDLASIAITRI
jgi:hypothetical protein